MTLGKLPFIEALRFYVRQSLSQSVEASRNTTKETSKRDVEAYWASQAISLARQNYRGSSATAAVLPEDPEEERPLANLIYVASNDADEYPWLWGLAGFGVRNSLDFRDDKYGIAHLLKCELGPRLMNFSADYAKYFPGEKMARSALRDGAEEARFCQLLKRESLQRLSHWKNPRTEYGVFPELELGNFVVSDPSANGEIVIRGKNSVLEWTPVNPSLGSSTDPQSAEEACAGLVWAGLNDWALPTREQIRSVVDNDLYSLFGTVFGHRLRHFLYYRKGPRDYGAISPYKKTDLPNHMGLHSYACARKRSR